MKFTQLPTNTFSKIQLNAGILLSSFDPSQPTVTAANIIGATTGGINFSDAIEYQDFGDDIDNCPKNTKELKKVVGRTVTMSGTFVTADTSVAKKLIAHADIASNKVTPRDIVNGADFSDIWWVGDYSDVNEDSGTGQTATTAGFMAIKLINALNTGGFQVQTTDRGKGNFAFSFTGHYSTSNIAIVPYEVYVTAGTAPSTT